jgi:CRP/FNR family transcriptional regulator
VPCTLEMLTPRASNASSPLTPLPPALSALCSPHAFRAGACLLVEGIVANSVYVLESGIVRVTGSAPGRLVTVGLRYRGSMLGSADVLLNRSSTMSADTLTNCSIRLIPSTAFRAAVVNDSVVSAWLHQRHSEDIAALQAAYVRTCAVGAAERLRILLTELAAADIEEAPDAPAVPVPLSRADLADAIGCTPEHLSRILPELERAGAIERQGRVLMARRTGVRGRLARVGTRI